MRATTMIARYTGNCRLGRDRIVPGETIVRDGRGWSHQTCRHRRPWATVPEPALTRTVDRDRARDDADYAAGIEDAVRWRFNRDAFGEEFAASEEYARDLRGLNGDW